MKEQKEIVIFSFTSTANKLNKQVQRKLSDCGYICEGYTAGKKKASEGLLVLEEDRKTWIGRYWGKKIFLFIGAAGIAIRSITPWVRDKYTDSAVLVMDEKGEYVVPLLSGHMGGAVAVAREIESAVGAVAVITTATDVQNKFAVDLFARNNHLQITDRYLVTEISSAILEGEPVGIYSELAYEGTLPAGLVRCDSVDSLSQYRYGIAVVRDDAVLCEGQKEREDLESSLLILKQQNPDRITVGIGCRRGTGKHQIKEALAKLLKEHNLSLDNVVKLASIDLKKDELGILALAEEYHIPFYTYTAAELGEVQGEMASSGFVQEVTGIDNVCERAARFCSPEGTLLQPKKIVDGIAFALVKEQTSLVFEEKKNSPRILIFGGTTESLALLGFLEKYRLDIYLSVATEYGKESVPKHGKVTILCGRMDREEILACIRKNAIDLVIDATHPFATAVTENIRWGCEKASTEYLRCLREGAEVTEPTAEAKAMGQAVYVSSVKDAAEYLKSTKGNILITTGSKELREFCEIPDYQARCYARVLSVIESVKTGAECGFFGRHLIAMQGPFSKEMNIAAIRYADAAFFVTKEAGDAGGMQEKIQACSETGTTMIIIRRPEEKGKSMEETLCYLEKKYGSYI